MPWHDNTPSAARPFASGAQRRRDTVTRKDVGEISMLQPRKEHNGDKTRITRKDKE